MDALQRTTNCTLEAGPFHLINKADASARIAGALDDPLGVLFRSLRSMLYDADYMIDDDVEAVAVDGRNVRSEARHSFR